MNRTIKLRIIASRAVFALSLVCLTTSLWAANDYHPTRLIVKFRDFPAASTLAGTLASAGASGYEPVVPATARVTKSRSELEKSFVFTFEDSLARRAAQAELETDNAVLSVELDYKMQLFHDPLYQYQWGLENNGQSYPGIIRVDGPGNDTLKFTNGIAGEDIRRAAVAELPTDRDRVLVAIIDTGVDYEHVDLAANVWRNPLEASGLPGVDDDLDGLIDDVYGYDFSGDSTDVVNVIPDPLPKDLIGHGTHVAGIVGAVTGNGIGVEGVASSVEIMCLKIFPNAFTSVSTKAIIYAVDHGAKVINASWGSPYFSTILNDAVKYARSNGCLFVAASGNSGDSSPFYPAVLPDAITVGACNSSGMATDFSTYGSWVDLSAPGRDILSLRARGTDLYADAGEPRIRIINSNYILADGTSMAAPHVAGAAAFLLSYSPGLRVDSLRNLLMATADQIADPQGREQGEYSIYTGYGRINLERATGVLSGSYAEISSPIPNSVQKGMVKIAGSAYSADGEEYLLEAKPASEGVWIEIARGNAAVITEQLAEWDSSPYDGPTPLRLRVGEGIAFTTTIRLLNNTRFAIESPTESDTIRSSVEIRGTATAPDFQAYDLYFYPDTEPKQPVFIEHGTVPVFSELIEDWSVGPVRSGSGTLELRLIAGGVVHEAFQPVVIKTLLNDDYPVAPATRPHFVSKSADLNGDGKLELITGGQAGTIILDPESLETYTLDPNGTVYQSSPAVYDFNGDGKDELAIVSDSGLTVVDGAGNNLPGWPRVFPVGAQFLSFPTPHVSDIDGDGSPEIVVLNSNGSFYCFRADGSAYFYSHNGKFASVNDTELPRQFSGAVPAFVFSYDFDRDGFRDIGGAYGVSGRRGGIYLFSGKNGQPLYPEIGARVISTGPPFGAVLADFDFDGEPEIAFAHYNDDYSITVRIIESNGTDLPGWPRHYDDKFQYLSPYPAAGDLDGDSIPELVVAFSAPLDGGEIYVWHGDGTPWLESELGRNDGFLVAVNNALSNPMILDTDNDGEPEIICRAGATLFANAEKVYSFELDGRITRGWPLYTFAPAGTVLYSPNTPLAGDFDQDGLLELYMGASDLKLYLWDLPTVASESAIVWNGFLNDSQNSGMLPFLAKPTAPPSEPPLPTSFRLAQNYPNPFNATTAIEFDLTAEVDTKLEVFNTLGQRVRTIVRGQMPAGFYRYEWDANDDRGERVASGVYFYRLSYGDAQETRTMVLLK